MLISYRGSAVSALLGSAAFASVALGGDTFRLTILHNNDGESQLVDAGSGLEDFGGAARFVTVVNALRDAAEIDGAAVLVSSGDNFLAGPEFNASLENGVPFFDSIAMTAAGYDALCIGNHEFDFGPGVLADFVAGFPSDVPFLSANLDVSAEPALAALEADGRIATRTVVEKDGVMIGIIGATTPNLPFISSPGGAVADPDVVGAIQAEIDALALEGVNHVILIAHLQSIQEDLALVKQLSGIDVVVAGGGDELLANPGPPGA